STPIEPTTERTEALAAAEEPALATPAEHGTDGTVVRFAGLYGPGRYRIDRYLDGPVAPGYLSLLHRDDAAGAVAHLLREGLARDELVLAVDDEPVERGGLAEWLADRCGVEPPPEDSQRRPSKRCRNDKLRGLGYEFADSTFREGYAPAIETR
ncbi:NAD(P)-dependent oxidoreductase, partial [Halobacteriales archaeon QH_10_67_13]